MKITVVGAGAVGATCADNIARAELADELVLLDIKEGLAEGKAQDMMQTATLLGFDTRITGSTNDYKKTAGSEVVVITSGIPRKPGMTREELIGTNAGIVRGVTNQILEHSPNAIIIVVSNPMDTMTYLTLTSSGLPKNRMIPLIGHATWNSIPVTNFLTEAQQQQIIADTMVGGATLTKLLGTSAWYAPGAAGAALVESIVRDEKKLFTCCVSLNGEYGQSDICLGVPVVIGKSGWEKILPMNLTAAEQELFNKSADAVRNMNEVLKTL
jgi:malate dehydrogenase